MGKNTAKNEDLKLAFAGIVATIAKESPEESPTALIGAGMISGILLCAADGPLMERVITAFFSESQLMGTRVSAQSIVAMFRALEEIHGKGQAGRKAGVEARQRILGAKATN